MRIIILFLFVMITISLQSQAQELVLLRENQRFEATQVDEDSWKFLIESEEFSLVKSSLIIELNKKIEILQADTTRLHKIIRAKEDLLESFENYEEKADAHIRVQEELITTADSLYTGYKDLYTDLKRITGLTTFALTGGVGLIDPPGDTWRPIGSLGARINTWSGQLQFGKEYWGVLVGVQWSLF